MPHAHPPRHTRVLGNVDLSSLGDSVVEEIRQFATCQTVAELNSLMFEAVKSEVGAMQALIADADAFDVAELMRLRAIPPVPIAAQHQGFDGSAAAIEIVALLLIARASRKPDSRPRFETRPHEAIEELHTRAKKLLRVSTFKMLADSSLRPDEPLARLAAEYQGNNVNVRSMQYASVHDAFNKALFDNEAMDELLSAELGFTYRQLDTIRHAIRDRYGEKLTGVRDLLAEIATESDGGRAPQSEERIAQGRRAAIDFIFLPGERAQFRAEDIATRTGLDVTVVSTVLGAFSLGFGNPRSASELVFDFLRGDNPLARRPLLVDESGNYVMTSLEIGTDSLRRITEGALKQTRHWKRYENIRTKVSERLTIDYLEEALKTKVRHTNLKYFAPNAGVEPSALDASCANPTVVAEQAEADALFLVEDVAVCVEVKGRTLAEQARRGDLARLNRELTATIGSAARQARRLESLIETNQGLWREDRTWLDLSFVREVRSIAVGLDDYGPLGVALDELRRAEVITDEKLPWVTSLHDLATISSVIDRPSELLLYIRRRSESGVAKHYRATDELDLFMLFLDGGLYVEPDPDEIHRLYPTTPSPSRHDRQLHLKSAQPTRVGTFTDPLDAWIYSIEDTNPFPAAKPEFNAHAWILQFVDFLIEGRKPGWFRFAADLLGLSGKTQAKLAASVNTISKRTKADHMPHQLMHSYAGSWGHPIFVARTRPQNEDRNDARKNLRLYMTAKKHQLQSDRALGLLLAENGRIEDVIYMNRPATADPDLDKLVKEMGLLPVGEDSRPGPPPSARRATRQLRGPRPKKRRT